MLIGTGSKSLTTQTGLAYSVGARVRVSNTVTPTNYMEGTVTAYTSASGAMTVNVDTIGGSGTLASWNVNLAGNVGSAGPAGANGTNGSTVLAGGGALSSGASTFYVAFGSFTVNTTESGVAIPLPVGGTLANLNVTASTPAGPGNTWTFTVRLAGASTGVTCAISGNASTSCSDTTHTSAVTAGQTVDLQAVPTSNPATMTITWSVVVQ